MTKLDTALSLIVILFSSASQMKKGYWLNQFVVTEKILILKTEKSFYTE